MNIGVFDSGIGGLTVLEEVVRLLPGYDYIFYGDSANNPYGEKSDEQLLEITSNIVDYLKERDCRLIVIACNTATTRCRHALMRKYPDITFIGTVPAVKLACDSNYSNILVLATPGTIASERMSQLVNDNIRPNQKIYPLACYGLADAIENHVPEAVDIILDSIKEQYGDKNIDCIVLGCTHYPFIKEDIQKRFPDADIIDGSNGVARETRRQLQLMNEYHESEKPGTLEFHFTRK